MVTPMVTRRMSASSTHRNLSVPNTIPVMNTATGIPDLIIWVIEVEEKEGEGSQIMCPIKHK